MAKDISTTFFCCEKNILRLNITISNQSIVMQILKAVCNLCEDKLCNSLFHTSTLRYTKRLKFLFLSQLIGQERDDSWVFRIHFSVFVKVHDLPKVSELHHEVHAVIRIWIFRSLIVFIPCKDFDNVVVLELAPELNFVYNLILHFPNA